MKIVGTLLLVGFALFCAFGFLASGENANPWPGRIVYGLLFAGSLSLAIRQWRKKG